jgi:hypothetical protein
MGEQVMSNVQFEYTFKTFEDFAKYCDIRAQTERTTSEGRVSKASEAKARERAAVWENVADLVRHSKIGD